jgi:hypothetical protein
MESTLTSVLSQFEGQIGGKFKPDKRFYDRVGVNQKRFGQLVRGEKPMYLFEARNLSEFFSVPLEQLCTK